MDALGTLLANLADSTHVLSVSRLHLLSGLDRADVERVRAAWPAIAAVASRTLAKVNWSAMMARQPDVPN